MHSARSNYLHSEATIGDDGEESSLTDTDDSEDDLDLVPDGENENEDNNELENFPCIRVAARIRPPTTDEEQGAEDCLHISEESKTVTVRSLRAAPPDWKKAGQALVQEFKCETFEDATQREFSRASRVDNYLKLAFEGYNCAVIAYGQTGSGKTYTIFGSTPGLADAKYKGRVRRRRDSVTMKEHGPLGVLSDFGLAPLAARRLFELLDMRMAMQLGADAGVVVDKNKAQPSSVQLDYKISVSMVEIYNEQLHDLLQGVGETEQISDSPSQRRGSQTQNRNSPRQRRGSQTQNSNSPRQRRNSQVQNNSSPRPGQRSQSQTPTKGKGNSDLIIRYNSLREDYYVKGATIVEVGDYQETTGVIEAGLQNRIIAQHNLNERSSRGHCLLTFYVNAIPRDNSASTQRKQADVSRYGKVMFVDLAGSENLRTSGSTGQRAKETAAINKSLFTLGKLVDSVAKQQKQKDEAERSKRRGSISTKLPPIQGKGPPKNEMSTPYRDSKLTMLLRDCLGGNSYTMMIACISPSDNHGPESLRTLRFIARASEVKNVARVHLSPKDQEIEELKQHIKKLKKENQMLRSQIDSEHQFPEKTVAKRKQYPKQQIADQSDSPVSSPRPPKNSLTERSTDTNRSPRTHQWSFRNELRDNNQSHGSFKSEDGHLSPIVSASHARQSRGLPPMPVQPQSSNDSAGNSHRHTPSISTSTQSGQGSPSHQHSNDKNISNALGDATTVNKEVNVSANEQQPVQVAGHSPITSTNSISSPRDSNHDLQSEHNREEIAKSPPTGHQGSEGERFPGTEPNCSGISNYDYEPVQVRGHSPTTSANAISPPRDSNCDFQSEQIQNSSPNEENTKSSPTGHYISEGERLRGTEQNLSGISNGERQQGLGLSPVASTNGLPSEGNRTYNHATKYSENSLSNQHVGDQGNTVNGSGNQRYSDNVGVSTNSGPTSADSSPDPFENDAFPTIYNPGDERTFGAESHRSRWSNNPNRPIPSAKYVTGSPSKVSPKAGMNEAVTPKGNMHSENSGNASPRSEHYQGLATPHKPSGKPSPAIISHESAPRNRRLKPVDLNDTNQ